MLDLLLARHVEGVSDMDDWGVCSCLNTLKKNPSLPMYICAYEQVYFAFYSCFYHLVVPNSLFVFSGFFITLQNLNTGNFTNTHIEIASLFLDQAGILLFVHILGYLSIYIMT